MENSVKNKNVILQFHILFLSGQSVILMIVKNILNVEMVIGNKQRIRLDTSNNVTQVIIIMLLLLEQNAMMIVLLKRYVEMVDSIEEKNVIQRYLYRSLKAQLVIDKVVKLQQSVAMENGKKIKIKQAIKKNVMVVIIDTKKQNVLIVCFNKNKNVEIKYYKQKKNVNLK